MCLQKLKDKLFMSDSNRRSSHEAVRLEINLPTGSQTFYSTLIINKKLSTIAIYFYVLERNVQYHCRRQTIITGSYRSSYLFPSRLPPASPRPPAG